MAVTKAQLVVWALISGLSVWGYTTLSRVKLPEEVGSSLPTAQTAVAEVPSAPVARANPVVTVLPATIPVFPFPEDLVAATVADNTVTITPTVTGSFADIPEDAIPQIPTFGEGVSLPDAPEVAESPAPKTEVDARETIQVAVDEPPIPMPSRPVVAQPVKAIPLSEVKTFYVVADALNVRATPSTSGPVLQKLPQGFAVAARAQANEWIGFLLRDGSTGWMRTDYLSDTMPPPRAASAPVIQTGDEPLNLMM